MAQLGAAIAPVVGSTVARFYRAGPRAGLRAAARDFTTHGHVVEFTRLVSSLQSPVQVRSAVPASSALVL